jgi:hypothetical protein
MAIKRSSRPEYRINLPITKKRIQFSAFNMRTERTMMMATQSGDAGELTSAVTNCLNDHILTEGIKAEDLPQAEAELLLLNMRAKSVGEKISLTVKDPEDEAKTYDVEIDLTDISVNLDPKFKDQVELSDGTIVQFQVPGLKILDGLDFQDQDFDGILELIIRCTKSICVEEEVYTPADTSEQDIKEFYLEMDTNDFTKISEEFFQRMPQLGTTVKVTKDNGDVMEVPITGLNSFL